MMLRTAMALLASLLVAPWLGAAWAHSASDPAATSITITRPAHISVGGPFSLIDQNGRILSDSDFRGTPTLIYFGYTNCPDTCPLDAQTISSVVDVLDGRGLKVVPIFISVDPQRDTPARLKEFLSAFHPRFVGLTGSIEAVSKITAAYGAVDDRVRQSAPDRYEVCTLLSRIWLRVTVRSSISFT